MVWNEAIGETFEGVWVCDETRKNSRKHIYNTYIKKNALNVH